jgi:hypothetical protein
LKSASKYKKVCSELCRPKIGCFHPLCLGKVFLVEISKH